MAASSIQKKRVPENKSSTAIYTGMMTGMVKVMIVLYCLNKLSAQFCVPSNIISSVKEVQSTTIPQFLEAKEFYNTADDSPHFSTTLNSEAWSLYDTISHSSSISSPLITNASQHVHPWLATCVSLFFLFFIIFMIITYGG
mmetsp:Transcript_4870/g.8092  ORF Transcript_4870/g.8092 Transcript_4870/m.8092 type:complete len:141 (-) Transcript_4870:174-596(-)